MPRAFLLCFLCHALLAQSQPVPAPDSLARVEGRVVNSVTGEPLRKADLMLHGGAGGDYTASSDANGHFAIERVAPGAYNLTSQHQNFAIMEYGSSRPGVPGSRITLTAGQSMTGLEIKMVPFGVISGKVVDQDGDPVAGVPISTMHWGFVRGGRQLLPASGGGSTNDRGEFRIYNLAAGRYFVAARPMRSDPYVPPVEMTSGRRTAPRIEAGRETFTSTFYPSAVDATTASPVILSAGQEVPGIDIQLRKTHTYTVQGKIAGIQKAHRYSLSMQPQDSFSSGNFGMGRAAAVRPEDASFTFHGVAPGRYTLIAMADNRVGARQDVTIGDGDLDGLVVALSDPGAVKGRVLMEASGTAKTPSLKGMRISLMAVDALPMNQPNASTADDGSFGMEEVAADRYKVNCSPLEGAYLKTIRWSGQVSNDGIVEMTPGGTSTLDLVFASTTAVIEGDVKTADDQPAPGAPVLLAPESRRESDFRLMMADRNGHFSAKGMAPGSYVALSTDASIFSMPDAAFLKALEKVTTPVSVEDNGHATVALKLVPEAVIEAVQ
jgi:Carboxypeptidase regulatory-like domain